MGDNPKQGWFVDVKQKGCFSDEMLSPSMPSVPCPVLPNIDLSKLQLPPSYNFEKRLDELEKKRGLCPITEISNSDRVFEGILNSIINSTIRM